MLWITLAAVVATGVGVWLIDQISLARISRAEDDR